MLYWTGTVITIKTNLILRHLDIFEDARGALVRRERIQWRVAILGGRAGLPAALRVFGHVVGLSWCESAELTANLRLMRPRPSFTWLP